MKRSLLLALSLIAGCGSDAPVDGAGPGAKIPNGEVPTTVLPPAESFLELKGSSVGIGTNLACAIAEDKKVVCWGGSGQVQRNALGKTAYLVDVGGVPTQISVGDDHACVRMDDGSAKCWGNASRGKLGNGDASYSQDAKTTAVLVAGLSNVDAIAAGYEHTCALAKGKVFCWGYNTTSEVGDGTTTERDTPFEVPGIDDATAVSAGSGSSCALRANGTVKCWGDSGYGQVGVLPASSSDRGIKTPTEVPGLAGATAVVAGDTVSCAIASGKVVCWGGTSSAAGGPAPKLVTVGGIDGATSIAIRRGHQNSKRPGCAVTAQGLYCWEEPTSGTAVGIRVDSPATPTQVSVGDVTFCGVFEDQRIKCWGENRYSMLGDGSFESHPTPIFVPGIADVTGLSVRDTENCVTSKDGKVRCWGTSYYDPESDGAVREIPEVAGATAIDNGGFRCGIFNGVVRCLYTAPNQDRLVDVIGISNAVETASSPQGKGCARLADGAVACWQSLNPPTSEIIPGVSGVKKIGLGLQTRFNDEVCVVQDTLRCWPNVPKAADAATLKQPAADFVGVTDFDAGEEYLCATMPDSVFCTTSAFGGVVGKVPGTGGATNLAAGYRHACATIAGKVQCWGGMGKGEVGPSAFEEMKAPITVPSVSPPVKLGAGGYHSCALQDDGRVQCWGDNAGGVISPRWHLRKQPTQVRVRW
jgi:alpha-tubulin suppressor-like RCC1 family protein